MSREVVERLRRMYEDFNAMGIIHRRVNG